MSPSWTGGIILNNIFSPKILSPFAWFRSDQGVTTVSGAVSQWNDLSGDGYNVSQSISAQRPTYNTSGGINGRPRLTFPTVDGNYGLFNSSFTLAVYPVEVFVVATTTATNPTYHAIMLDLGNQNNIVYQVSGTNNLGFYNGTGPDAVAISVNTPFIADAYNNGDITSFITINGTTTSTGYVGITAQAATKLTIGNYNGIAAGGNGFGGDIYEIIVFNYHLSSAQRTQVLNYLSSLYKITI